MIRGQPQIETQILKYSSTSHNNGNPLSISPDIYPDTLVWFTKEEIARLDAFLAKYERGPNAAKRTGIYRSHGKV